MNDFETSSEVSSETSSEVSSETSSEVSSETSSEVSSETSSEVVYQTVVVDTSNIETMLHDIKVGVGYTSLFCVMLFFVVTVWIIGNWLSHFF